jgi:protein-disulfide isomerase
MTQYKKLLIGGVLSMLLMVPLAPQVHAASPDYSMLTPEARVTLLNALIKQLVYLQEQLDIIRAAEKQAATASDPRPVTPRDYTKGAADAQIQILTFTDFDCPFCKKFHETLNSIVTTYPEVSITYRHFPLEQLHPNAKDLSVAAECVGQLKGDVEYYSFVDSVFNSRDFNETTDMSKITSYATAAGVRSADFAACRKSTAALAAVEADMKEGTAIRVQGTPTSYVFKNGEFGIINGAQPQMVVEQMIETLLQE